jgi:hypothetical protein
MKVELLCLGVVNKPSPISEGVTKISINSQLCKGINLTTRHTQAQRAPRVAIVHDAVKKLGRVLPHPSVVFHAYNSANTPWVDRTLSHYTSVKRGKVSSNSLTHKATQFGDSTSPVCISTFKCLFIQTQPTRALIDIGGGYHLEALNIRSHHSPSFPSSILHFHLIAPSGLILNHSIIYSSSQHSFHEPGYQKALNLMSGVCHSTSTGVLSTKHSITNEFSTTIRSW